ncbi:MAG: DctP family TRAP transporter solute-binding subunit [Spirochaetales bacterium]|jgi:tripartite ATP-independent transporter DctP family solute receptor|nr:DctP family TRAP transporter solute-binding subunit [Spirochaetales bacterium]
MSFKKGLSVFLAVTLFIVLSACSSRDGNSAAGSSASSRGQVVMEIKCETPPPESVNFVQLMHNYFFPELEARTQGRYKGDIYPNSQLAGGDQMTAVNMVQQGSIELGILGSGPLGSFVKDLPYTAMPFLFNSFEEVDKVFDMNSESGKYLRELHNKAGFELLGVVENGFKQITNSKRQLYKPSDANGIKLRVSSNPILADCWKANGANPTTYNISEAYSAFQQGVLDGQENAFVTTIIPSKFYEVQKYITVANYAYEIFLMVMNRNVWEKIDSETQQIMKTLAAKVIADAKVLDRASEQQAIKTVTDYGCDVYMWTPEDVKVWKAAFAAEMEKHRALFDQKLVAAIENSK